MRILNWNVERPQLSSTMNQRKAKKALSFSPDLIVLTETSVAIDLGSEFESILTLPSKRKPGDGEAVAGISFRKDRFSVVQQIETADPAEAVCLLLNAPHQNLLVYASIIPYHGYRGKDQASRFWEEHQRAIEWHGSDWKKIREQFAFVPFIAAGDYNQHRDGVGKYGSTKVRQQLGKAFDDAGLVCVTETDFKSTNGLSRRNVDHVALSNDLFANLEDVSAWEGKDDNGQLSDHNGITVDIGFD